MKQGKLIWRRLSFSFRGAASSCSVNAIRLILPFWVCNAVSWEKEHTPVANHKSHSLQIQRSSSCTALAGLGVSLGA